MAHVKSSVKGEPRFIPVNLLLAPLKQFCLNRQPLKNGKHARCSLKTCDYSDQADKFPPLSAVGRVVRVEHPKMAPDA
jgi:hypothetical protein